MPGWRSRLGLVEWEEAGINTSWCRSAAVDCNLYLAFYFRHVAAQLATAGCVAVCMCGLAMGPLDGLSPCASPGSGSALCRSAYTRLEATIK